MTDGKVHWMTQFIILNISFNKIANHLFVETLNLSGVRGLIHVNLFSKINEAAGM